LEIRFWNELIGKKEDTDFGWRANCEEKEDEE
jgi:hypothetical protein